MKHKAVFSSSIRKMENSGTRSNLLAYILIFITVLSFPFTTVRAQEPDLTSIVQQLQQRVGQSEQKTTTLERRLFGIITPIFTRTGHVGVKSDEVIRLQEFLKQFPDIYPEGLVTGYFGPFTENAVKRFQLKESIDSVGIVGPITRTRLNELITKGIIGIVNFPDTGGVPGIAGAVGATGVTGAIGATGLTGAIGATGYTGISGGQGPTGRIGETGLTGATGTIGIAGATGLTGSVGGVGATGAVGNVGATGITGATGATGNIGSTGLTGATGSMGATGITGTTGLTGSVGGIGATGATGAIGSIGATGAIGGIGATGLTGSMGATGSTGSAGATGATGSMGATGITGTTGLTGSVGGIGATGATGAIGGVGATGSTGSAGATGATGNIGSTGLTGSAGGVGATGAVGGIGATGTTGTTGATGATGPTGPAGTSGVIASAQYVQLGSQPATIGAGQPFTYTTTILSTPSITSVTALFNPPFTTSGTVFTLTNIGRYEINYQMIYPTDGGIVLYFGSTISSMAPLPYTMIGKSPNGAVSGSVIIETTTINSFLSVNAAAGNAIAIDIPPNSSTTNQSATTISIKQL